MEFWAQYNATKALRKIKRRDLINAGALPRSTPGTEGFGFRDPVGHSTTRGKGGRLPRLPQTAPGANEGRFVRSGIALQQHFSRWHQDVSRGPFWAALEPMTEHYTSRGSFMYPQPSAVNTECVHAYPLPSGHLWAGSRRGNMSVHGRRKSVG